MPLETEPAPAPVAQVPPPPPAATPAPTPTPSVPATPATPSPAAGSGSTGAAAGSGALAQTPGAPATPAPAPTYTAEQFTALQRQLDQYKQYEPYIHLGYQAYQRGQQTPAAPANPAAPAQPAAPAHPWGLPQFDFALLNLVAKDPQTGGLVNLPGAPPDAAFRVQQYQEQLQKAQRELFADPHKALRPIVEAIAQEVANKQYDQRFTGHQQTQQAEQILAQNEGWLYERGQDGQAATQFNPATGQHVPVLSAAGKFYAQQITYAERQGIADPRVQHEFAIGRVKTALYEAQQRQQAAPAAGQQAAQQFVQGAAAAAAAASPPPNPAAPAPALPQTLTLRDRLMQQFQSQGLTDAAVVSQVNRLG